jgi:uncharacterized protein YoxC
MGIAAVLIVQVDPAVASALQRIAIAQIIMAIALGVVVLLLLIAGLLSLRMISDVRKGIREAQRSVQRLLPSAAPIVEKAKHVADDAEDVSGKVRRQVDDLMGTLNEVNESLRDATRTAKARVREFGAVLDVVQTEAEELLLDTAATARGVHTAAERLRRPRIPAPPRPAVPAMAETNEKGGR